MALYAGYIFLEIQDLLQNNRNHRFPDLVDNDPRTIYGTIRSPRWFAVSIIVH